MELGFCVVFVSLRKLKVGGKTYAASNHVFKPFGEPEERYCIS